LLPRARRRNFSTTLSSLFLYQTKRILNYVRELR
jgi:hypothetical protein